jgi:hypothetical protein
MYRLSEDLIGKLTDLRVEGGAQVHEHAARRQRREKLTADGKLVILAADHPARMVTAVGDDPLAMGDRADYLGRIIHVLQSGFVDGLMGTPDILEEALAVDWIQCQAGGDSFLDGKLLVGCMNRGGLAGCSFEMEDTFTAFTAPQMVSLGVDGAKMMLRLEPLEAASGRTITACARAINDCLDCGLTVFLEPLMVRFEGGRYEVDRSREAMVRICGVASALGKSSWKTWLKLPFSVDYPRIVNSTTCPVLMLGGPSTGHPEVLIEEFTAGMRAGENVRGALVGRNLLYPGDADPAQVAAAVWTVVHGDNAQ